MEPGVLRDAARITTAALASQRGRVQWRCAAIAVIARHITAKDARDSTLTPGTPLQVTQAVYGRGLSCVHWQELRPGHEGNQREESERPVSARNTDDPGTSQ